MRLWLALVQKCKGLCIGSTSISHGYHILKKDNLEIGPKYDEKSMCNRSQTIYILFVFYLGWDKSQIQS